MKISLVALASTAIVPGQILIRAQSTSRTTSPVTSIVTLPSATPSATGSPSAAPANIAVNERPSGALNATAWALIYSYPLYIFGNFAGAVLQNVAVNQIFHQRQLASIDSAAVIKPNVDTVYSRVVLDLSQNDVVLTIPEITDRYWIYPIYDAFGNVVAEIGVVNGNTAGDYLIRRGDDYNARSGFRNATEIVNGTIPNLQLSTRYKGIVNVPTTYGTSLIRLLVKQNTTEDLDIIHKYQDASKLTPLPRTTTLAPVPPGNLSSLAPNGTLLNISTPQKLLDFAAKFIPYNQPNTTAERYRVAAILGQAGIYDGVFTPQSGVNLTLAAQIANASITVDVNQPSHIRAQGNDWLLSIESYQGQFGANYAPRAYVATTGYQQLTAAQVLYPGYKALGFTSAVSLPPNSSLLFTFSGKPKLYSPGFWSLTVYGENQYLIPNTLGRPSVGDRLYTLKYQGRNATVYGPNASTTDGPFQVLIQPANLVPPANWTGNWLPTAQNFTFITRWYTPQPEMTNGSYVYPKGEIIKAIV